MYNSFNPFGDTVAVPSPTEVGFLRRDSGDVTALDNAGQYYDIVGVFTDDSLNEEFSTASNGVITYNGSGGTFLINGTSDCEVSTACALHYGMVQNTIVIGETPHDFSNQSKTENLSITGLVSVANGDTFQVQSKSDTTSTTLTVLTLSVTFTKA